jgi:lipoprotein-anchoring transpeptidase ErfK/SrfK
MAALVLVIAATSMAACGTSVSRTATVVQAPPAVDTASGRLVGAPEPEWLAADAAGPAVPLYRAPGKLGADHQMLPNPTIEGMPLTFLVRRVKGAWLQVQIAQRPNGSTAWIPTSSVVLRSEPYRVEVKLSAHRLWLYRGGQVVATMAAAVGAPDSPTPTGHFFVDAHVRLLDPTGPYGAGQVSVAGFSNVYQTFGGGIGQIAIHGTDQPNLIGQGVSHGCVRVTNPQILRLLQIVPTGAPVDILP